MSQSTNLNRKVSAPASKLLKRIMLYALMWFKVTTPATPSVGRIAYILVVIGGILLILLGLLSLIAGL